MTFGYECEYFLRDDKGEIVYNVPITLPHDGAGSLVEVRSQAFECPYMVEASFTVAHVELAVAVSKLGLRLWNINEYHYPKEKPHSFRGLKETAGFHIHFGGPDAPPIPETVAKLDKIFGIAPGRDSFYYSYRPKTWGWEYRRLPATVDVANVTQVLIKEFVK